MQLDNTIIVLIGFAGTGKYTIGRELCEQTGAKLIHNHLINNPIFQVVDADGIKQLPFGVWNKVKAVRAIVYEAIRELSPPELSFVFTIELFESSPGDHEAFDNLEQLAAARGSMFVPIRLICEVEELCRRVSHPARVGMIKSLSSDEARRKSATESVLARNHQHEFTVDVTKTTARESAAVILQQLQMITGQSR